MEECPNGKEINPKTGRCINKCREKEERHPLTYICMSKCKLGPRDKITGLCPKAKPKKLIKLKKICNDDQEINPKTGRCIMKCKENEERHPLTYICMSKCKVGPRDKITGLCPKAKPKKLIKLKKICNDDQELNPKTGRCINKCKENEERHPVLKICIAKCKNGKIRDKITGRCIKIITKKDPLKNIKIIEKKSTSKTSSKTNSKSKSKTSSKSSSKSTSKSSSKSTSKSSSKTNNDLYYPDINDSNFDKKIASNNEFYIHKIGKFPIIKSIDDFNKLANKLCGKLELSLYQYFISQYMSHRTPYRSVLLYHGVGVGKTCSAITLAELILSANIMESNEPVIWVIMPQSLKGNFKGQIFDMDFKSLKDLTNQCTGDNYIKLLNIDEKMFEDKVNLNKRFKENLKKRYKLFTYDSFSKYIDKEYKDKIVDNKVIIIDEAHNIRSTNNNDKESYLKIKETLRKGINNRLVLLSATPMYNEPRDILDLFNLMLINDKRENILDKYKKIFNSNINLKLDDNAIELIKKLSSNYISYLKGKNPFTFALKLNPSLSGVKILEKVPIKDPSNKNIPKDELSWLKNIKDDIIISKLGTFQNKKIKKLKNVNLNNIEINSFDEEFEDAEEDNTQEKESVNNKNQNMRLLQPMNIVYDDSIGEKGFYTFFTKTTQKDPLFVKYNTQYENALYPDEENLGKYSGKFLNMCNFIRKSKGIVIIYSRFLYSGIIPFAICLEHLGYNRYGANNILQNPKIVTDIPVYDGVKHPKYCILTSDKKEIMGSTTIDNLIKVINNDKNIYGENIKIILITPVASEGLSFFNAREIHLIEPWYHFNRPEQIIGRGIRNCRHQKLPFEERNVTVFMHASANDDMTIETIDIHALRISTRKYKESQKIDNIISNNALDCVLMKNINYFPKSLFQLGVVELETSQGKRIKYEFGDNPKYEPTCSQNIKVDKSGYRSEIYKHLLKRGQTEIRNQLKKYIEQNIYYISLEQLFKDIDMDEDILMYTINKSIKPKILINNYYITLYKDGIKLNKIDNINYSNRIKIIIKDDDESKSKSNKSQDNIEKIIKLINIDYKNIIKTTIYLYLLDANSLQILINHILYNYKDIKDKNEESLLYIADCLYKQGVLIKKTELPSYKYNDNIFIGYYNIYNTNNNLEDMSNNDIILYNDIKKIDKVGITETELKEIKKHRYKIQTIPVNMELEKMPFGLILPDEDKKSKKIKNIVKIFSTDTDKGRGRKCKDWNITELNKFINQLDNDNTKMKNKELLCNYIAEELMKKNRLILFPVYKPNIKR